jgi:hypothetical protein
LCHVAKQFNLESLALTLGVSSSESNEKKQTLKAMVKLLRSGKVHTLEISQGRFCKELTKGLKSMKSLKHLILAGEQLFKCHTHLAEALAATSLLPLEHLELRKMTLNHVERS